MNYLRNYLLLSICTLSLLSCSIDEDIAIEEANNVGVTEQKTINQEPIEEKFASKPLFPSITVNRPHLHYYIDENGLPMSYEDIMKFKRKNPYNTVWKKPCFYYYPSGSSRLLFNQITNIYSEYWEMETDCLGTPKGGLDGRDNDISNQDDY